MRRLVLFALLALTACGEAPAPTLPPETPVTLSSYDEITVWRDPAGCEYLVVKQRGEVVAITPRRASASNGRCKS